MSKPYVYTAVGDSLTFGTGAPDQLGFAYRVQRTVGAYRTVDWRNFGVVGATASDLLEHLRENEELRRSVAQSELVTLTAGGNDLIQAALKMYVEGASRSMKPPMRRFAIAYGELVEELAKLNRLTERSSLLVVTDCYNPFPQVRDAVLWVQFVNRCIRRTAAAYGGKVLVANVYEAFLGKEVAYMAEDLVHPNADGHEALARAVSAALASARGRSA